VLFRSVMCLVFQSSIVRPIVGVHSNQAKSTCLHLSKPIRSGLPVHGQPLQTDPFPAGQPPAQLPRRERAINGPLAV
jgi:hypothetical protein